MPPMYFIYQLRAGRLADEARHSQSSSYAGAGVTTRFTINIQNVLREIFHRYRFFRCHDVK